MTPNAAWLIGIHEEEQLAAHPARMLVYGGDEHYLRERVEVAGVGAHR
jgi:hypothetical protein